MDRFEKNIARGLCPKCETILNINKDDISINCKVCGLEIDLENLGNNFADLVVDGIAEGSVSEVIVDDVGSKYEVGDKLTFTANSADTNVDAASGSLLYFYGLKEFNYYTVLFSISRTMGIISQMVINRAMGIPIMRPKSITTDWIKNNI